MMLRIPILFLCAALLAPAPALAHSGGLDANGCHGGSKPYHCHRGGGASGLKEIPALTDAGDKDCGDFDSWEQAQQFFLSSGYGDPHRLDGDGDGVACEALR